MKSPRSRSARGSSAHRRRRRARSAPCCRAAARGGSPSGCRARRASSRWSRRARGLRRRSRAQAYGAPAPAGGTDGGVVLLPATSVDIRTRGGARLEDDLARSQTTRSGRNTMTGTTLTRIRRRRFVRALELAVARLRHEPARALARAQPRRSRRQRAPSPRCAETSSRSTQTSRARRPARSRPPARRPRSRASCGARSARARPGPRTSTCRPGPGRAPVTRSRPSSRRRDAHAQLLQLVERDAGIGVPGEVARQAARHEAADQLHRLQVGVELRGRQLHLRQRLAGQRRATPACARRGAPRCAPCRSGSGRARSRPAIRAGRSRAAPGDRARGSSRSRPGGRLGAREHQQRLGQERRVVAPERHHEQEQHAAGRRGPARRPCRSRGTTPAPSAQRRLPGCGSAWKNPSPRTCW